MIMPELLEDVLNANEIYIIFIISLKHETAKLGGRDNPNYLIRPCSRFSAGQCNVYCSVLPGPASHHSIHITIS